MFRMLCNPSSGSNELCLTEITLSGLWIFFLRLVGVWQPNFEPAVCVHGPTGWELVPSPSDRAHTHTHRRFKIGLQTPTRHTKNIHKPLSVISVKHSSLLPDDGLHNIRNKSE